MQKAVSQPAGRNFTSTMQHNKYSKPGIEDKKRLSVKSMLDG
jgi:hypothetical protein